jgi:predicted house-cleaning noncanonical NTP pyrophosphatase (MazG superfamily)
MITVYNKLVRDRIPELIKKEKKKCKAEVLSDADYLVALYRKLEEELAEYRANPSIEELADLLEALRATALARGYSLEELERVRAEKEASRGAFQNRLFLRYTED